ncbi:MAG: diguanylate cyclase response regulator [bacterium]|nr:diguanylate cyclase response regulator [bacterium]
MQTVMVVDDSPLMHRLLAGHLAEEGCAVRGALDPESAFEQARADPPDLILLDLVMAGGCGYDLLRRLKADPRTTDVPVIVVSGTSDVRGKVRAFDLGAVDYVVKPFDRAELRARVRSALRVKRYHDLLATRSSIDALTGLYNRAHLDRRLDEEIAGARRYRRRFALVLIDVDHFKEVNDTYGHPCGDRVLGSIAEVLQTSLRSGDAACRFGGEEFALLLVESGREEAALVSLRVRERVAALQTMAAGMPLTRTVSLGAATSDDFAASTLTRESIVEAADRALYAAKRSGRNRLCLSPPRTVAASNAPSRLAV